MKLAIRNLNAELFDRAFAIIDDLELDVAETQAEVVAGNLRGVWTGTEFHANEPEVLRYLEEVELRDKRESLDRAVAATAELFYLTPRAVEEIILRAAHDVTDPNLPWTCESCRSPLPLV